MNSTAQKATKHLFRLTLYVASSQVRVTRWLDATTGLRSLKGRCEDRRKGWTLRSSMVALRQCGKTEMLCSALGAPRGTIVDKLNSL